LFLYLHFNFPGHARNPGSDRRIVSESNNKTREVSSNCKLPTKPTRLSNQSVKHTIFQLYTKNPFPPFPERAGDGWEESFGSRRHGILGTTPIARLFRDPRHPI
jgi:hypothetical protein